MHNDIHLVFFPLKVGKALENHPAVQGVPLYQRQWIDVEQSFSCIYDHDNCPTGGTLMFWMKILIVNSLSEVVMVDCDQQGHVPTPMGMELTAEMGTL